LSANGGGGGRIDVRHAHQFDVRHAGVFFRMKFTEIADPDDPDANLVIDCAHMIGPVRKLRARVLGGSKPGGRR
jgi:hypothetical protein